MTTIIYIVQFRRIGTQRWYDRYNPHWCGLTSLRKAKKLAQELKRTASADLSFRVVKQTRIEEEQP